MDGVLNIQKDVYRIRTSVATADHGMSFVNVAHMQQHLYSIKAAMARIDESMEDDERREGGRVVFRPIKLPTPQMPSSRFFPPHLAKPNSADSSSSTNSARSHPNSVFLSRARSGDGGPQGFEGCKKNVRHRVSSDEPWCFYSLRTQLPACN